MYKYLKSFFGPKKAVVISLSQIEDRLNINMEEAVQDLEKSVINLDTTSQGVNKNINDNSTFDDNLHKNVNALFDRCNAVNENAQKAKKALAKISNASITIIGKLKNVLTTLLKVQTTLSSIDTKLKSMSQKTSSHTTKKEIIDARRTLNFSIDKIILPVFNMIKPIAAKLAELLEKSSNKP